MYHSAADLSTPYPNQQTTPKLKDALHLVQDEVKRGLPINLKISPDVVPLESFDMKISDTPTPLPSALQDEYYSFAMADDLDDDPLDLSEVVYVDSFGMERCGEKRSFELKDFKGDHTSNQARGEFVLEDRSMAVDRSYEEGDVAVGHGGVTYHRFGRGGILPGYPTQEGMSKLIIDRMMDDQLRFSGGTVFVISFLHKYLLFLSLKVENNNSSPVPAAISRSTNSSEGYPTSFPSSRNMDIRHSDSGSGNEIGNVRTVPCRMFHFIFFSIHLLFFTSFNSRFSDTRRKEGESHFRD